MTASTVYDVVRETTQRWPDNDMLCAPPMPGRAYHPDGIAYSYGEAWRRIEALRERYAAAGYGHGHRVALLLEQRPEFFFHYLALNGLGCAIVPVNPDYRHDEMLYQMAHSEADLAVATESRVGDLARVGAARSTPLPVLSFERLPDALPPPARPADGGAPGIDSECGLLYTSGTTGRPKGCRLSNGYYVNAGAWYRDIGGRAALRQGDRLLNPLPLFHMNAQGVAATAMFLLGGLPDLARPLPPGPR